MEAGAKKHLEHDDLWDLSVRDQAGPVFKDFAAKLKSTVDPIKAPQVKRQPCDMIWLVVCVSSLYTRLLPSRRTQRTPTNPDQE